MSKPRAVKVSTRGRSPAPTPGRAPAAGVNVEGRPITVLAPAGVQLSDEVRARLRVLSGGSPPAAPPPVAPAAPAPVPAAALEARGKHERLWTLVGKKGAVVAVAGMEAACERWDPGCEVEEPEPEDVAELGDATGDTIREFFADRSVKAWHRVVLMLVVILATMWLTRVPSKIKRDKPEEQAREPEPARVAPAAAPAAAPVAPRKLRSVPAAGAPSGLVRAGVADVGLPPIPPPAS